VDETAYCILSVAYGNSVNPQYESPYWKYKKNKDSKFLGGRVDDQTVAVAMVQSHHSRQDIQ